MEKKLNEVDYVEQELAELCTRLEQTFAVVDTLAKIPAQFEVLGQNYQQLKQQLDEGIVNREAIASEVASEVEASITGRLTKLETDIEFKSKELRVELAHLHEELSSADIHISSYNSQLAKQVSEIREEVTLRLTNFWQECVTNETTRTTLTEIIGSTLNTEIEDFIQQLGEAGFNPQNFEKQEMLETELRLTKSSLQEVQRHLQMIRSFTTVTGVTILVTLALVIVQLLNRT